MAGACRSFDLSKYPSELIHLTDAHAPTLLYSAASCSRWAIRWLIITQSSRVILSVRLQATCRRNMVIRTLGECPGVSQLNSPRAVQMNLQIIFWHTLKHWIRMNTIDVVTNLNGLSWRRLGQISHCRNPVSWRRRLQPQLLWPHTMLLLKSSKINNHPNVKSPFTLSFFYNFQLRKP